MTGDVLFDKSARDFASNIDDAISANRYVRGELFVRAAREHLAQGARVLDYGCGPGRLSKLVAQVGLRVHGLDPSPGMLAEARAQNLEGLDVEFGQLSDNGDSLDTGAYDGIVCSSTIEYVRDPMHLLRQFKRALRGRGKLILSFSNRRSLFRTYARLRLPAAPHLKLQHTIWTFDECVVALRKAGFNMVTGATYFDAAPFDRRPALSFLSESSFVGTLGLVVAEVGS